jgi:hypothetical protein
VEVSISSSRRVTDLIFTVRTFNIVSWGCGIEPQGELPTRDMFSWAVRSIPINQASRHSAIHGLGVRVNVLHSRTIAAELHGNVRATTAPCEVGVHRMKRF